MKRAMNGTKSVTAALLVLAFLAALALPAAAAAVPANGSKLNINTASVQQLTALPGFGAVKARAIVDFRTEHGPFTSADDLVLVPGIGNKLLGRIRDLVTVNPN